MSILFLKQEANSLLHPRKNLPITYSVFLPVSSNDWKFIHMDNWESSNQFMYRITSLNFLPLLIWRIENLTTRSSIICHKEQISLHVYVPEKRYKAPKDREVNSMCALYVWNVQRNWGVYFSLFFMSLSNQENGDQWQSSDLCWPFNCHIHSRNTQKFEHSVNDDLP